MRDRPYRLFALAAAVVLVSAHFIVALATSVLRAAEPVVAFLAAPFLRTGPEWRQAAAIRSALSAGDESSLARLQTARTGAFHALMLQRSASRRPSVPLFGFGGGALGGSAALA
jgi:hypothetical protein